MTDDRYEHLNLLADRALASIEWEGESYWGLDGKRPFGFSGRGGIAASVLEIVRIAPEGEDGEFTDDQVDYGMDLMGDLARHIGDRWRAMRKPDAGPEQE